MLRLIEENLVRQNKAMMLLLILLEEEFSRLMSLKPQSVSQIELSIQELMRQMAAERMALRKKIQAMNPEALQISDIYPQLNEETVERFSGMLAILDDTEQKCAMQAGKNGEMAMALFDQSKNLLDFMHNQIKPKNTMAYGRSGRFAQASTNARLLTGRL